MDRVLARYRAPWGVMLKLITMGTVGLLGGVAIATLLFSPPELQKPPWQGFWLLSMVVIPLAILVGSAIFMVRGYRLTPSHLQIERLGWRTQIDLKTLVSAEANPKAMAGSLRLFGNGGLFAIVGLFRNQQLGNYRAYATDLKRCVVIKLADRVVVVTPDRPDDLVNQLSLLAHS